MYLSTRTSLKLPALDASFGRTTQRLPLSRCSPLLRLRSPAQERESDVSGEQGIRKDTTDSRTGYWASFSLCALHINLRCFFKIHEGLSFPQRVHPRCERKTLRHAVPQVSPPNALRRLPPRPGSKAAPHQHFSTHSSVLKGAAA